MPALATLATWRPGTWVLVALLLVVQGQLWLGSGSLPYVRELQAQVNAQQAANAAARERNQQLALELTDLREGLEMVEERARSELGMLKPNEILVHVSPVPR